MKRHIILIIVLLVFSAQLRAQSVSKVGTTAASFLAIDVGPRATAMGGANVAVANDVTAMYWNPAGIAGVRSFQASFTNTKWIADLSFNYVGAVLPLEKFGTLGINATFLTMDQEERTTIASPDGSGEFFDAGSYAVGISYARQLTHLFSIGFNAKYITERLYHMKSQGAAFDVGALFDTGVLGMKLGMNISNFGTKMQLDGRDTQVQVDIAPGLNGNNPNINARLQGDQYDLPLMFRFGISSDVLKGENNSLIVAVDALHPSDDFEYVNVGAEYELYDMISIRAGYNELFSDDSESSFSLGAGLHYKISETTIAIDYSYLDFGVFDAIHMFSVGLQL